MFQSICENIPNPAELRQWMQMKYPGSSARPPPPPLTISIPATLPGPGSAPHSYGKSILHATFFFRFSVSVPKLNTRLDERCAHALQKKVCNLAGVACQRGVGRHGLEDGEETALPIHCALNWHRLCFNPHVFNTLHNIKQHNLGYHCAHWFTLMIINITLN